ncbi:hypothetical protein [Burkholderia sp. 3C]
MFTNYSSIVWITFSLNATICIAKSNRRWRAGSEKLRIFNSAGCIERQAVRRDKAEEAVNTRRFRYDTAGQLAQIEGGHKGATDYRYGSVGRLIKFRTLDHRRLAALKFAGKCVPHQIAS